MKALITTVLLIAVSINIYAINQDQLDKIFATAYLHMKSENYPKAIAEYENVISNNLVQNNDMLAAVHYYKMLATYKSGSYKTVINLADKILMKFPENNLYKKFALFYSANAHTMLGDHEKALDLYEIVIEADFSFAEAYINKAITIVKKNKLVKRDYTIPIIENRAKIDSEKQVTSKYNNLVNYFDQALETDTKNMDIWFGKGLVYFGLNEMQKAKVTLDLVSRRDKKNVYSMLCRASIYVLIKKPAKAIELYDKILEIRKDNIYILKLKANTLILQKDFVEANKIIDRLLIHSPSDYKTLLDKAFISANLKNYDDAIKACNIILKNSPAKINAFMIKGMALTKQKKLKTALKNYDDALALYPQNAQLYYFKAKIYYKLKDNKNLFKNLEKAFKLNKGLKEQAKKEFKNLLSNSKLKKVVE